MEASEREKTLLETDNRRLKREVEVLRLRIDSVMGNQTDPARSSLQGVVRDGPKSPSFPFHDVKGGHAAWAKTAREDDERTRTESGETCTTSSISPGEVGPGGYGSAGLTGIGIVLSGDESRKGSWDGALP